MATDLWRHVLTLAQEGLACALLSVSPEPEAMSINEIEWRQPKLACHAREKSNISANHVSVLDCVCVCV